MSRSLLRSIAKHAERKEIALAKFAIDRYGETVSLADVHVDVKVLFGLAFELRQARDAGDKAAISVAADAIADFIDRFDSQKKSLTAKSNTDTVAVT